MSSKRGSPEWGGGSQFVMYGLPPTMPDPIIVPVDPNVYPTTIPPALPDFNGYMAFLQRLYDLEQKVIGLEKELSLTKDSIKEAKEEQLNINRRCLDMFICLVNDINDIKGSPVRVQLAKNKKNTGKTGKHPNKTKGTKSIKKAKRTR